MDQLLALKKIGATCFRQIEVVRVPLKNIRKLLFPLVSLGGEPSTKRWMNIRARWKYVEKFASSFCPTSLPPPRLSHRSIPCKRNKTDSIESVRVKNGNYRTTSWASRECKVFTVFQICFLLFPFFFFAFLFCHKKVNCQPLRNVYVASISKTFFRFFCLCSALNCEKIMTIIFVITCFE